MLPAYAGMSPNTRARRWRTWRAPRLRGDEPNPGKSLIGTNSLTVMMALVWYALRRQHLSEVVDFDEWAASVEDLARVTEDEPDPTQTGQSAD